MAGLTTHMLRLQNTQFWQLSSLIFAANKKKMIYSPVQKALQTRAFKVNISKEEKQSLELDAHFKSNS